MSTHPPAGRRLWAALHLLDHQLLDRSGRMAGCVDDLELTEADDGSLHVSAILSGPGVLAPRLGAGRFGRWRRRSQQLWAAEEGRSDPTRIAFGRVRAIGSHVTLAADADELASADTERWVRDHVVGRLPGSAHVAE
jgi:hypothetical protein